MKSVVVGTVVGIPKSLPARGAWIEIKRTFYKHLTELSLPARGAWIEI